MAQSITSDLSSRIIARATVKMPGTCGELVQGTLGGTPFHISCPIDVYSTVSVELTDTTCDWAFPPDTPKAAAAVQAALRHFGADGLGGRLSIRASLPRAKGMASSTADVAGAIHAVAQALGREISPAEVAHLALEIEPTDGSIFPDIALFDHRGGELYENL
ncbi:MAG: GHMP kinase, partial [Chloroflexi bacterium]|nr:GHMP kinase [Chloroflexota bacterium]